MAQNDYIKGITVVISGDTSELTKSLKNVDTQVKETENELKTVQRLLKLDPKNTELLAKKQKLLSSEIDTTKQKLDALKKAKEQADKTIKDGTADQLKAYEKLQKEIDNTEKKLNTLKTNASKFTQAGEQLTGVGNKMTEVGQKGMVLTGAITALGAGVAATAETTREYREDMSRLEAAFVSAGKTTESAKNAYNDFFVILGESDRSVEAVNHLAKLCNSEQELADWSTICAGVSATFGDSLPIEGLTEAANETAKVGKVTGPLADALNWAGVSEDAFNEKLAQCNSEQERSQLITSTLTGLYQEAAIKFKSMNADVIASREATQKWNDAIAELGATVEPIITAIREKVAQLLNWFNQLNDGQKKILAGTLAATAAVPPLLTSIGNLISAGGQLSKMLGKFEASANASNISIKKLWTLILAHPFAAAAAGAVGLVTGLELIERAGNKDIDTMIKLSSESGRLVKETDGLIAKTDEAENSLFAQKNTIDDLIDRLYALEGQDDKTTSAKEEMHSIVNQLNSLIPDLNLNIDDETGRLNMQRSVVQGLANDYINLAYAQAYYAQLQTATQTKIKIEANNKSIEEQMSKIPAREDRKFVDRLLGTSENLSIVLTKDYAENLRSIEKLDAEIAEYSQKITEYSSKINQGNNDLKGGFKSVGSAAAGAGKQAAKSAKSASKAVTKEVDTMKQAFDDELKTLKEDLSYGFITEKDYYSKLAEMRDYYLEKGSSDWWTYTKEIIKYERDMADELKNVMADVSADIKSTTEEYLNQRKQLTEPFENALKSDSLYDTTVLKDGDKTIEMHSLRDFSEEKKRIDEFESRFTKISERLRKFFGDDEDGLDEILNTIRESPYSEGSNLLNLLDSVDDNELQKYVDGFKGRNQSAHNTAERSYSKELDQLSDDFNASINEILSGIPEEFKNVGATAAEYFGKGFTEQIAAVLQSIKDITLMDFGGLSPSAAGVTNNSVNNSKTNNINVNVSNNGSQQDVTSLGQKIVNAIWLGGEL